jgi:hypothetical protein
MDRWIAKRGKGALRFLAEDWDQYGPQADPEAAKRARKEEFDRMTEAVQREMRGET